MRRRKFIGSVTGASIAALSGCSEGNVGGGGGGSTETVSLRAASMAPEDAFYITRFSYPVWLEKVNNKLDDYEVEAEFHGAGAIGGPGELYDLAAEGTVDVGVDLPAYQGGRMPLTMVASAPTMFSPTVESHSAAAQAFHDMTTPGGESEILYNEWSQIGVRPIMAFTTPPLQIHTKDLEIANIDQLEGVRTVAGGLLVNMAKRLGMTPADVPHPDIHPALQSGTVSAVMSPLAATYSNSWNDQINYCTTDLNLGGYPVGLAMGTDTLDELPDPVEEALITAGRETVADYASNVQQGIEEVVLNSEKVAQEKPFDKSSQYLAYETEAEAEITSAIEPVVEEWINQQDDPAAAEDVVETYRTLIDNYK